MSSSRIKRASKVASSTATLDDLRIGAEMETVVVPFMVDDQGREVVTYAFRPVASQLRA